MSAAELDKSAIVKLPFPESQYYKVAGIKKQIVLHHTASGRGIDGDYRHWLNTPERIATCVIIDSDGVINQTFESKYWGHHLGIPNDTFVKFAIKRSEATNLTLNQESVAVEVDCWGPLVFHDKAYRSYTGAAVPFNEVQEYETPFKTIPASPYFTQHGFANKEARLYQKYSEKQIDSLRKLILYWAKTYDIPTRYNEDMWNISRNALQGKPGIWTHVSYRKDKADCHPQPELVKMLRTL